MWLNRFFSKKVFRGVPGSFLSLQLEWHLFWFFRLLVIDLKALFVFSSPEIE